MTDLPPYTGDTTTCTKCGHEGATTTYRKTGDQRPGDFFALPPGDRVERLERRCPRCTYTWDEALADRPPATTDRDRLLALLNSFGINASWEHSCGGEHEDVVTLTAGEDGVAGDQPGLYCLFAFHEESGAFKYAGVWQ